MSGFDSTERLEQQLRETESRFRTMADAAPVLLWMSRPDGLCDFFNQTWLDFTGRTLEDERGVGWAEGVYFEDLERCLQIYTDAFNQRAVFEMEYRLRRRDGVYRWVLDRGTPRYTPDGTFAGYIGSCVDITERKALESELREAVRIRDEFLSIASHELRTPLTSLKLRAERIQQQIERNGAEALASGRLERDARSAVGHVRQLVNMVDVLLDVSRLSEGPLTLDREELELGALVAEVADALAEPAATAGCTLRVAVEGVAIAHWDRFRIEQVVTNLLSNAIKYGRGKPVEVSVAADPSGKNALITVSDQGPGISPEHQPRLFERFSRFVSARHYGGFGLGLWITREIVRAHGGSISVDSRPGAGASFQVELPLATGVGALAGPASARAAEPARD